MDKLVGTKQEGDALQGRGVLQSEEEGEVRNHDLAESLSRLTNEHVPFRTGKAPDIGCQKGELTDRYAAATALSWQNLERPTRSEAGLEVLHARFFIVTMRHVKKAATVAGFSKVLAQVASA
jgi:hypothetical protein